PASGCGRAWPGSLTDRPSRWRAGRAGAPRPDSPPARPRRRRPAGWRRTGLRVAVRRPPARRSVRARCPRARPEPRRWGRLDEAGGRRRRRRALPPRPPPVAAQARLRGRRPRRLLPARGTTAATNSCCELVADAPDRLQVLRIRGVVLELFAQPSHVDIHGAGLPAVGVAPHALEDQLARQHL